MIFENREEAGQKLSLKLIKYKNKNPYVLALPRGGVVVGSQIAQQLSSPLNVLISRKIGLPGQPEYGVGAIAENDILILDTAVIDFLDVDKNMLEQTIIKEKEELIRRILSYRHGEILPDMNGKSLIIADDGLATGVTARAAIYAAKKLNPKILVFSVPVSAPDTAGTVRHLVDDFVCLFEPKNFTSVGQWYRNFNQVTDQEVKSILQNLN